MLLRTLLVAALAATATLALAACGDDDDDDPTVAGTGTTSTGTTATGTASASATADGGSSPAATATSDATSPSGGGGGGVSPGDDDLEEFQGLLEGNSDSTYSITYEIVSVSGGQTMESLWTLAQDPPRSAAIIESEGQRIWVIDDGTNQYTCFESGAQGQCLRANQGGMGGPDIVDVDDVADTAEASANLREIESRSIAGRDARCFEYDGATADDTGVMCLDEDRGYMLFLDTAGTTMTAVEVRDDVPESAFEPPFDVIG